MQKWYGLDMDVQKKRVTGTARLKKYDYRYTSAVLWYGKRAYCCRTGRCCKQRWYAGDAIQHCTGYGNDKLGHIRSLLSPDQRVTEEDAMIAWTDIGFLSIE